MTHYRCEGCHTTFKTNSKNPRCPECHKVVYKMHMKQKPNTKTQYQVKKTLGEKE